MLFRPLKFLVVLVSVFANFESKAKVFDLLPLFGGVESISERIKGDQILKEALTINGISTTLSVEICEVSLGEYLRELKRLHPDYHLALSKDSIVFEETLKDGWKLKHYLTQVSSQHPILHFSIKLPEKLPENISWPQNLPMPQSADVKTSISLDDRGSIYADFTSLIAPDFAQSTFADSMRANGWRSDFTGQRYPARNAGTFFFNPKTKKVIVVNFAESDDGKVTGSIYMKPLR